MQLVDYLYARDGIRCSHSRLEIQVSSGTHSCSCIVLLMQCRHRHMHMLAWLLCQPGCSCLIADWVYMLPLKQRKLQKLCIAATGLAHVCRLPALLFFKKQPAHSFMSASYTQQRTKHCMTADFEHTPCAADQDCDGCSCQTMPSNVL